MYRYIYMHSVSGTTPNRFGRKIRVQPVPRCYRTDNRTECYSIVRRRDRIGVTKINFILTGSLLMVGAFRLDSHLLKSKTDFTSDILPLILRRYVHIPCFVVWSCCSSAVLIQHKKIKFHLGAETKFKAGGFSLPYRLF